MRNIRIDLEYDGTAYNGWQIQPGLPTVEQTLRDALSRLFGGESISLTGAGRTDAGVHARQQVVNCHTESILTTEVILKGVNALLPFDISATQVVVVPDSWNARFDAIERRYRYQILVGHPRSALQRTFFTHVHYSLDVDAMRQAAEFLKGEHDFSAFRSTHCDANNPRRDLRRLSITRKGREMTIDLAANAFLRNMVRVIVGTLLDVGRGKITPDAVLAILNSRDRNLAGDTAPPQGLILWSVKYPRL